IRIGELFSAADAGSRSNGDCRSSPGACRMQPDSQGGSAGQADRHQPERQHPAGSQSEDRTRRRTGDAAATWPLRGPEVSPYCITRRRMLMALAPACAFAGVLSTAPAKAQSLGDLKTQGLVGERADGYLGVVAPT